MSTDIKFIIDVCALNRSYELMSPFVNDINIYITRYYMNTERNVCPNLLQHL